MSANGAVQKKLEETAVKVEQYIEKLLESKKPEMLYEAGRHIIAAGGKRLRPYLVLKSCELVGGDSELAIPYAAALEILHNFTLIHDDIMDNDLLRRGVPTVHKKWGVPMAILGGDLLFVKVYQSMVEPAMKGAVPIDRALACIDRVTKATVTLCEGQALDIIYSGNEDISREDYISMVEGKTSALFRACAEVGAIIGGGETDDVETLGSFAWDSGVAFQIVDDILGVVSHEETLGKPVGSDIREGKKTLLMIHALEKATQAEKGELLNVLGNEDASEQDIVLATKILKKTGSIEYAREKADEYVNRAMDTISYFPDSESKEELIELIEYFTKRTY